MNRFLQIILGRAPLLALVGAALLGVAGCDLFISNVSSEEAACPSDTPPEIAQGQTEFSDEELRCAVYTEYKFPDGFYQEDLSLSGRDGEASIYYENTVSIDSSNQWNEFCTNDLSRARALSEKSAESSSYYRQLVDTTVTEKFFEFRRVYEQNPRDVLLSRVHTCTYIVPFDSFRYAGSLGPLDEGSAFIGTFSPVPVTRAKVRELAEYLFFLSHYNSGGVALSSVSRPGDEEAIEHVVYGTSTTYGDFGLCDQITLTAFSYRVNRETGHIQYSKNPIRTVKARCPDE